MIITKKFYFVNIFLKKLLTSYNYSDIIILVITRGKDFLKFLAVKGVSYEIVCNS